MVRGGNTSSDHLETFKNRLLQPVPDKLPAGSPVGTSSCYSWRLGSAVTKVTGRCDGMPFPSQGVPPADQRAGFNKLIRPNDNSNATASIQVLTGSDRYSRVLRKNDFFQNAVTSSQREAGPVRGTTASTRP